MLARVIRDTVNWATGTAMIFQELRIRTPHSIKGRAKYHTDAAP